MENDALSRRAFLRAGTAGAAAAGTAGTAAAQEASETVLVGPDNSLVFDPEDLTVEVGTTVNFVWESDNHNIVVDSQPEGANWEGTEGGASTTYDTGHEYSFTFETTGTYEYACEPHRSAGMVGSVEVVEELETAAPSGPAVPDSAKSLIVATTFAMVATLVLAFFFLKFGGDSPNIEAE